MMVVLQVGMFTRRYGQWNQAEHLHVCESPAELRDHLAAIVAVCLETAGQDGFTMGEGSTYLNVHLLPVRDREQVVEGVMRGIDKTREVMKVKPGDQGPAEDEIDKAFREAMNDDPETP